MVNVIGYELSDAIKAIESAGFKVGDVFREPSEMDTGKIFYQSVPSGEKCAKKYTVVDLKVSLKYTDEALRDLEEKRRLEEEKATESSSNETIG